MAGVGSVKEWLILLGIGGVVGLIIWSGFSVLTLKTILLWILISFGFLTLIFHASGSSLLRLMRSVMGAENDEQTKTTFSEEEVLRRRQRSLNKKQNVFDDRNEKYRENFLQPKQEAQLQKKQAEFQKFHPNWKGEGHRLGNVPDAAHVCSCGQAHDDVDTDEMDPDCLLDYIEDTQSSADEQESSNETNAELQTLNDQTVVENTLRLRRKDIINDPKANSLESKVSTSDSFEEPALGSPGSITVALRCPNGETKKRRFVIESHIQVLFDYVESLGYPATNYSIMTTYPRQPLINSTQTFNELGLTHDVVLVIDDRED